MSEYIHHVAGRVRLKMPQMRKDPRRAQEIQSAACRISGVTSVDANIVTGSLLVRYDKHQVDVATIMRSMAEMGLLSAPVRSRAPQQRPEASPLTDKVVGVLVEKLIERSAIALVGAAFTLL
jgi:copper chaperone CopZ